MNKLEYEAFLRSVKQCQEKSQRTLSNIDNTLSGVKQTLKDIQITNKNIDRIKEEYSSVMDKLASKIANSLLNLDEPFKKREGITYQHLPIQISEAEVAKKILKYKRILIMTGAGVSVGSGIPTFRGRGGLYSNGFNYKQKFYEPEEFITYKFFKEDSEGIWKWIDDIYNLASKAKPNQVHQQIDSLAKNLSKLGKEVVLATQNIDDLHIKPQNKQYEYYNIHGSCKYLRCDEHHFTDYKPEIKNETCKVCGKDLRPHILFFDQKYGRDYGEEVKDRQFPLVICIGSSAKTGLIIGKVQNAQEVIQINPQPVIQIGKVYRFTNKTEDVLKNINEALKK